MHLLSLGLLAVASAIYPADHWDYSTKMTKSNFDETVKSNVDAGKTLFAPAWNSVVKTFAKNSDVAFADVNLSEEPIRDGHNPGAGGWPTIRYFNKETGYGGKAYTQKTSKAICDELGDVAMMQAYVEEAGHTSLCSTETGAGCNDKEKAFIDTWKGKSKADVDAQLTRLQGMAAGKMTSDLKTWLNQRMAILSQFQKAHAKSEL